MPRGRATAPRSRAAGRPRARASDSAQGSRILPASSPVSAPGPRSGRPPMFAAYADVPGYPLVFPLFYGALAYFALAMARHLRIFAATVPSGPFASVPRRAAGVLLYALAQARMFRDARAGTDARRDLLGIRGPHDRDGRHRHRGPRPGDRGLAAGRGAVDRPDGDPERGGRRRAPRGRLCGLAPAGLASARAWRSPGARSSSWA